MGTHSQPRRVEPRRLILIGVVWAALVAVVLAVSAALDSPPGTPEVASEPANLPPLTLALDRELPASAISQPNVQAEIAELRRLANEGNAAGRWVELGSALQSVRDYQGALLAYRRALAIEGTRLDARVGLIMLDAASAQGRERAASAMADLARANPTSQLVAFNQGMVAVYRQDLPTVRSAFTVAERLGPTTILGTAAARFRTAADGKLKP